MPFSPPTSDKRAEASGQTLYRGPATSTLVEALLQRGGEGDLAEARAAIEALAAIPTDPGLVLVEVPLLRMRALLAQAEGDEAGYRDFRDRYRKMANCLGFEGHMALAEAMPYGPKQCPGVARARGSGPRRPW